MTVQKTRIKTMNTNIEAVKFGNLKKHGFSHVNRTFPTFFKIDSIFEFGVPIRVFHDTSHDIGIASAEMSLGGTILNA